MKVFLKKKNKKRQYGREQHKNLPEHKKQKCVDYRKKYYIKIDKKL